jgi:hypothetical protein
MDPRVKEIVDRLNVIIASGGPMSDFVLTFFRTMLDQWQGFAGVHAAPPPFGATPLMQLVESMLPTVEAEDRSSAAVIRLLLDKARASRDPEERRRLAVALEWFYLYFTKQSDLEFESWLARREDS